MRALLSQLPRARHLLSAEQRRALELLGSIPHGVAEDLLVLAHGFDRDMIAGLVHTGLREHGARLWRRAGLRLRSSV